MKYLSLPCNVFFGDILYTSRERQKFLITPGLVNLLYGGTKSLTLDIVLVNSTNSHFQGPGM